MLPSIGDASAAIKAGDAMRRRARASCEGASALTFRYAPLGVEWTM